MADDRPAPDPTAPQVHHTIELDADVDTVLEALHDPDLLAQWLGVWTADETDPSSATILTDDGVARRVREVHHGARSVNWTWSPDSDPEAASHVRIEVAPTEDGRSRLMVHEHLVAGAGRVRASASGASAALLSSGWVVALLMLQVLVVLRAAVPALV
jgi:uncharacterized protein YndB with AHSA1/START domain